MTCQHDRLAIFVALLLAGAAPVAMAQQPSGVDVRISVGGETPGAAAAKVDETDLRRYAEQKAYDRVDAEIRRLKALYPGWQPPEDLLSQGETPAEDDGIDLSYLWAAFGAGDLAAVRDEIGILRRLHPKWSPPRELEHMIDTEETKRYVSEAAANGEWERITRYHQGNPSRFRCSDSTIEAIWSVAEAYHKLGDDERTFAVYGDAISSCDSADLRLSTLQKALALHDSKRFPALFELEGKRARTVEQEARLQQIEKDWRGTPADTKAIAASRRFGTAMDAAGKGSIGADDLAYLVQAAQSRRDSNAAMVLGWYFYNKEKSQEAASWFEQSMAWQANEKAAEGLTLTYRKLGRLDEAAQIAEAWQGMSAAIDEIRSGTQRQRVWEAINSGHPSDALLMIRQARESGDDHVDLVIAQGWALHGAERPTEAALAFREALNDARITPEQIDEAAFGLAIAYVSVGLTDDARTILYSHNLPFERVDDVERALAVRQIIDTFDAGAYRDVEGMIANLKSRWPASDSLGLVEGWTLFHVGKYAEAMRVFDDLYTAGHSPEAAEGAAAARVRMYGSYAS